jgi:acetoin:2,6-dichlorophenolindophenol oxidoreductase subunit alpha
MKFNNEDLILLYRNMVRTRKIDELAIKGLLEGKVLSFYHSGQGSEALAIGSTMPLRKDDFLWPHHRGHGIGYLIGKGLDGKAFLAEHWGKVTGSCLGISGFHICEPEHGILGLAGTIGSIFPMSLGWGLAAKKSGKQQVVLGCFGDGGSNRGTLHEAFNLSAVWKLPIVWVCDNNGIAQFTPIKDTYPKDDIADLAGGYNMPGMVVDGMDVIAVYEAVEAAVDRARKGDGPSLIEAKTARYRPHAEGIPDLEHADPRSPEEIAELKKRDPIESFKAKLLKQGSLTDELINQIDIEASEEANETEKFCMESGFPEASILGRLIYAE